ncbi:MAG: PQQ-like beta-propeller repeat protein [Aureliella sp.]
MKLSDPVRSRPASLRWSARTALLAVLALFPAVLSAADPVDWTYWRGPEGTGVTRDKGLPTDWSPKGKNVVWSNDELGTRCTPVIMNDRLYMVKRYKPDTNEEGEMLVCANASTGEVIWTEDHNVFLSDAPAERVGWSSVFADPSSGNVYWLGLGCEFSCLDAETGEVKWSHSMSEEYGMLSTYGGRTNFPIVFEDLVIVSGVMTQWGASAVPAHRFVGFDKNSGAAVWFSSTTPKPKDTTYSSPFLTTLDGQAVIVFGAGDGKVHAMQPRTGKIVWSYLASNRGIFTSPTVVDGIVYCGFHEQSVVDTRIRGGLFAFDGRKSGSISEEDLLWKIDGVEIEKGQPVIVDERLYVVDIKGEFLVVDIKTGEEIFSRKIGRKPGYVLYGDGHIYCSEAAGNFWVFKPTEDGVEEVAHVRLNRDEIIAAPIFDHSRLYVTTANTIYCIANPDVTPDADPMPETPGETPKEQDTKVAQIQIAPVEAMLAPGQSTPYQVRSYNAKGQFLGVVDAEFSVEGGGEVSSEGVYTAPETADHIATFITAKADGVESTARTRVLPPLPWSFDFDDGEVPITWIGANYRHIPKEVVGEKVLAKRSNIPLGTRSQSWMGWTTLHDYTVEADFYSTVNEVTGNRADMGVINQRYTLDMMNKGEGLLQIRSWTPRTEQRFSETIPFAWEGNVWYRVKFQSENADGKVTLRGKVWKRDEAEPEAWQIEATDGVPNTTGSPGLFGKSDLAEFYIDNIKVYDNK